MLLSAIFYVSSICCSIEQLSTFRAELRTMISSRAKPSYCCSIINKVSGILDTQVTMAIMAFTSKYHLVQRKSHFFASSNAAQGIGACRMYSTRPDRRLRPLLLCNRRPSERIQATKLSLYLQTSTKPLKLSYAQPLERSPPPRIFPD